MGIFTTGSMIVGRLGKDIVLHKKIDDLHEWAEGNEMDYTSPYFDAVAEHCYFGYYISDIEVKDIEGWLEIVQEQATKFKELTELDAHLIGSAHVC